MEWAQFFLLMIMLVTMFKLLKVDIDFNRKEVDKDTKDILKILIEIKQENKHFHSRLCSIEEKNKK